MSVSPHSNDLIAVSTQRLPRRKRNERGMTTAEYAVGTVAAAGFAGVLIKILLDPSISELILRLIMAVLQALMKIPGL